MSVAVPFTLVGELMLAYVRWLLSPRLFWLWMLVVSNALLFSLYTYRGEVAIRVAGLGLELLGLLIAIRGLIATRGFFGLPSLQGLFLRWMSERPRWRRGLVLDAEAGSYSVSGMIGRGGSWTAIHAQDTVEKKVESLILNAERLRRDLESTQREIDDLSKKQADALKSEFEAREKAVADLKSQLRAATTDGLLESLVGLCWILAGMIMSTMSAELWQLLH